MNTYIATKSHVEAAGVSHGAPPDSFLDQLIAWGKTAPDEIFAVNSEPGDIYGKVRDHVINGMRVPLLGPWTSPLHRRASMMEILRVLPAFESDWRWNEGADITAGHERPEEVEAGIFQVSANSLALSKDLVACIDRHGVAHTAPAFCSAMKSNHNLALEYCARLLRKRTDWDGPINRGWVQSNVSRDSVAEFQLLLSQP